MIHIKSGVAYSFDYQCQAEECKDEWPAKKCKKCKGKKCKKDDNCKEKCRKKCKLCDVRSVFEQIY